MSKFGTVVRIILAIWATYRLASMISSEEGPYLAFPHRLKSQMGVFEQIRIDAGVYDYGSDGKPATSFARGISCPLCTGVYLSGLLGIMVFAPTKVGDWFLAWMGISGAQVFLENLTSDEAIQGAMEDIADSLED